MNAATCDKTPLQQIIDAGLAPIYEAIREVAQSDQASCTWALFDLDNPIQWYISKRLEWQAVVTTASYIFTGHYGALQMPLTWTLFLSRCKHAFEDLGRDPKVSEVYEWTLTEKAQELLRHEEKSKAS